MKKTAIVVAATAAVLFAPQAFAQAKNFEGASIGLQVRSVSTKLEATTAAVTSTADSTTQDLMLVLGYDFAVANSVVLGVGMDVGTLTRKLGTLSGSTTTAESKTNVGIFATAGYTVTDTVLVYGKIAQQGANVTSSIGGNVSFNGPAFGIGAKAMFGKNWQGTVEYLNSTYGEQKIGAETDKLKSTSLSVGVSYKF
jgi:outer membrane immunogenic protein